MKNSQLLPHEWLSVVIIISFILTISFVSYFRSYDMPLASQDIPADHIEVTVEGAIDNPGTFLLKKNSTLEKLFAKLQFNQDADLSNFKIEKKLRHHSKIIIPSSQIQIFILGAVDNPGIFSVAKGTRYCDLLPLVVINNDADTKIFTKKRKVKDQEVILINYRNNSN